jgi:hypothetical protein
MKAAPFFEILVNADYMEKCTNMWFFTIKTNKIV